MIKTRFDKATDALYEAFFNGTLAKGTCTACAIGNIICRAQDLGYHVFIMDSERERTTQEVIDVIENNTGRLWYVGAKFTYSFVTSSK